jgi:NAD(P)H-dependent flavin oxidoreductase YrpB (nitropropane dioxygenase family)
MVPEDHRRFARRLLDEHDIPAPPEDEKRSGMMGWTEATAKPLLDCALQHPKVRLIANALGTPPADVIKRVHDHGLLFAALAGSVKHAKHHAEAGIDIVICQGTEGGGHTGEIGSIVLWPEVIDAIAPTPVLAAGGVGNGRQIAAALAMGAQGVWGGTLWLTVEESNTAPGQMESYLAASSGDTIRSRSYTGKPCRMLKNDWTEAWERDDTPDPLPMPMQMLVAIEAVGAAHRYPEQSKGIAFNPCGQIVGRATKVRKARDVVLELVEEYVEAVDRLAELSKV